MKIMYDYQILWLQKFGGISRYFYELINELKKYPHCVEIELPVVSAQNEYFKEVLRYKNWSSKVLERIANELFTVMQIFKSYFIKKPYDILHLTFYLPLVFPLFFQSKKTKVVITVYDMIHEKFMPEERRLIRNKRKWIKKADGIIAISDCTKKDLLQYYPDVEADKIQVIYLGYSDGIKLKEIPLSERFILFVGNRDGYKNFSLLLQPCISHILKERGIKLICVGGGKPTKKEFNRILDLRMNDCVKYLEATDEELAYLYTKAECMVYPSLYEGFGIPILEAFKWGCPAVLSNILCFHEIAGDAAMYFDGKSGESLADCLDRILIDGELKNSLTTLGKRRLSLYSWEKAAKQTFQFYEEIVSKQKRREYVSLAKGE